MGTHVALEEVEKRDIFVAEAPHERPADGTLFGRKIWVSRGYEKLTALLVWQYCGIVGILRVCTSGPAEASWMEAHIL